MSATEAPERIGPYRLLRRLGEGGMGVVHLGLDSEGREVAVKVLHPHVASDLKARDRLTREVETMRRVRSGRVAEVLDADLTGATPYIVTRFAPGRTLEQTVLDDGPLGDRDLVKLARGLCEALVSIHAADVIHRDLKPANVMLAETPSGGVEPLVIDFGIAHLVNATRLTQTGMFVGTPGYLAPEIIRDTEITQAADVHALAATVFFAATGKPPFGSGTFESVCYNILEGKAQTELAPPWMRGWLRLALATEARSRPTAASLLRLARALDPSVAVFKEESTATQVRGGTDLERTLPDGTQILADGTRVLDDGTRVLGDGTKVLNDGTMILKDGTRVDQTRRPDENAASPSRSGQTYSDLLPPVNYAKPQREARPPKEKRKGQRPAPPPYQPAPYQPPGHPPPLPDQRVAGYPAPVQPRAAVPPYAPPPPPPAPAAPREAYRTGHPVLAALLLAVVVGAACLLPVKVAMVAIGAALLLRVGNYLFGDLAERRQVRGSRGADPVLALLGAPWALIKAALATLIHVPLALMFAVCVWGALRYGVSFGEDRAAALAAGAFVGGLFLLPGSGGARKAVQKSLTAAIRSPGVGMVASLVVGTLAFFTIMTATTAAADWSPWDPPSQVIDSQIADLKQKGEETVTNLVGGVVDDLLGRIGLGFLTFWN